MKKEVKYLPRWQDTTIKRIYSGKLLPIIVLTGARQTGKTTLSLHNFPDLQYINLDDPILRNELTETMGIELWHGRYPDAIIDEIQKVPPLVDTIKGIVDKYTESKYILTGSSQLIINRKINESLAGRAYYFDLYPFSFAETLGEAKIPRLVQMLSECTNIKEMTQYINEESRTHSISSQEWSIIQETWQKYNIWGGLPKQFIGIDFETWKEWLTQYIRVFLERDLLDITRIQDLDSFLKFQRLLAYQASYLLNYSQFARDLNLSVPTVQSYCNYLKVSYQVEFVPPYTKNPRKRLIKSPKICFLDMGILRQLTNMLNEMTGEFFENVVISEMIKIIRQLCNDWNIYHLRTRDGREVDVLLEKDGKVFAFECKLRGIPTKHDARHLKNLHEILNEEIIGKFVIHNGDRIYQDISAQTHAVPAKWLFS